MLRPRIGIRVTAAALACALGAAAAPVPASFGAPAPAAPPAGRTIRIAVLATFDHTPMRDSEDRFVVDPDAEAGGREAAAVLAELSRSRPDLRLSLAPDAAMLDDWEDAADGYTLVTPAGISDVAPEMRTPLACSRALAALRSAAASGTPVLGSPYALPDLRDWGSSITTEELRARVALSSRTMRLALGSRVTTGALVSLGGLSSPLVRTLSAAGFTHAVLDPGTMPAGRRGPAPGAHPCRGATLTILAADPALSSALADPSTTPARLAALLRPRLAATGTPRPALALLRFGAASPASATHVSYLLGALAGMPGVELVDVRDVAVAGGPAVTPPRQPARRSTAPAGYWDDVAQARVRVIALLRAAGFRSERARHAVRLLSLAGSRDWEGPAGGWALADRGRAYTVAAAGAADGVFREIGISVPDVMLSGARGRVPVNLANRGDTALRLTVRASSNDLRRPRSTATVLRVEPGENIFSVPVDLGSELSGRLMLRIVAGDVVLTETSAKVRASYLDRFALVAVVLIGLAAGLVYIRRGLRAAQARRRSAGRDEDEGEPTEGQERLFDASALEPGGPQDDT